MTEKAYPLGVALREARERKQLGVREVARLISRSPIAGMNVSPSYYSQVKIGYYKKPSMDFLWAVSVVLGLDPLELFVLSRPKIPQHLAKENRRKFLFDGPETADTSG